MGLGLTIGTVIVSLSVFVLFAFGASRAEKAVAAKARLAREAVQAKAVAKPASGRKK